jgi:hypothetical protein
VDAAGTDNESTGEHGFFDTEIKLGWWVPIEVDVWEEPFWFPSEPLVPFRRIEQVVWVSVCEWVDV